jgi:hypothetical protein
MATKKMRRLVWWDGTMGMPKGPMSQSANAAGFRGHSSTCFSMAISLLLSLCRGLAGRLSAACAKQPNHTREAACFFFFFLSLMTLFAVNMEFVWALSEFATCDMQHSGYQLEYKKGKPIWFHMPTWSSHHG